MEDFAKENKVPIINENGRKVFIEIIKKYIVNDQNIYKNEDELVSLEDYLKYL